MATMSPLRRRMIEDMTIRNLSPATQQSYLYAVAKFSRHFSVPPAQLGTEQVRAYQLHLIAQKRSWSHINQVACALRFFYGVTLGQKEAVARIVSGRSPRSFRRCSIRGDHPLSGSGCGLAQPCRADDSLCGGSAGRRGCAPEGLRDRQHADVDPRRARQRRQRPLCDAVAAPAGRSSRLLAAGAARSVAVSGPGARHAMLAPAPCRPPAGLQGDRRGSASPSRPTRSGTVLPLIFWRAGPTSGSFRSCSGTSSWRRRPVMRRSPQT